MNTSLQPSSSSSQPANGHMKHIVSVLVSSSLYTVFDKMIKTDYSMKKQMRTTDCSFLDSLCLVSYYTCKYMKKKIIIFVINPFAVLTSRPFDFPCKKFYTWWL